MAGKIIAIDDCKLNLQSGMRGNQPVVACGLIYQKHDPLHYLQIDRHMESLDAAAAYVEAATEETAHQIYADIMASDGHVIEAFNRVFTASAQLAANRFHLLELAAHKGQSPMKTGKK